ncbi:MAG: DUF4920 domain-containing protein [Holophagales bacterium]|jgi:hypothetical protein|nr:DUF4920 domain-containing protein [Holophagales bacterium]
MIRKLTLLLPLVMAAPLMAQQFGKPLTLKEETNISDILTNPDAYNGKLVQVRGTIIDVCPSMGCYITISGDQRAHSIVFKVEDGVISFPVTLKGQEVVAEGIVVKMIPKATEEHCEAEDTAKHGEKKDATPIKVRINGLGAVAK